MTDFSSTPVLSFDRVRLEPLTTAHEAGLREAVCDGEVWKLNVTTAPEPHQVADYIRTAIQTRLAFAVIDEDTGKIVGSTSLYHIDPAIPRLYIGFTWYALSAQRTHINTASQRAIERLGAHQDGILRCHKLRKDGSVRDTVEYSLLREEWPQARVKLLEKAAAYDAS